jgi:hypothetical protein
VTAPRPQGGATAADPPAPERQAVYAAVTEHAQRLSEALDAGTPDFLDGLISRWVDQWLAGADLARVRALTSLARDRAQALADVSAAQARLEVTRVRYGRRALDLGVPLSTPSAEPEES